MSLPVEHRHLVCIAMRRDRLSAEQKTALSKGGAGRFTILPMPHNWRVTSDCLEGSYTKCRQSGYGP